MPENPLQHLKRLNELMKTMVEQVTTVDGGMKSLLDRF
jgi:hypothetical protein